MTILDDKMVPGMLKIADKLGKDVTVEVITTPTYVPSTGVGTVPKDTPVTKKLVGMSAVDDFYVANGTAEDGDVQGLFAASGLGLTPSKGTKITIDSVEWVVYRFETITPGAQVIAYKVFMRKA